MKNIADLDVTVDIENYVRLSNSSIDTKEKIRAFRFINLSSDVIKNMCAMEEQQFKEFINAIQDIEGDVSNRMTICLKVFFIKRNYQLLYSHSPIASLNALSTAASSPSSGSAKILHIRFPTWSRAIEEPLKAGEVK